MNKERELHVRTIDGHSILVTLSAEDTVQHLKVHLEQLNWPPAVESLSSHCHIYLQGRKLETSRQVGSLPVGAGKFLVLVPYTRKIRTKYSSLGGRRCERDCENEAGQNELGSASEQRHEETNSSSAATQPSDGGTTDLQQKNMDPSEALWHTIARDLAAVNSESQESQATEAVVFGKNASSCEYVPSVSNHTIRLGAGKIRSTAEEVLQDQEELQERKESATGRKKRPRDTTGTSGDKRTATSSAGNTTLHKSLKDTHPKNDSSHEEVLDRTEQSVARNAMTANLGKRKSDSNVLGLPPALEMCTRLFASLNTVCGFLQNHHIQATWQNVKQALQQFYCPEADVVTAEDIQHLADLCPNVVVLSNLTSERGESSFFIDLLDPSDLNKGKVCGKKSAVIATNMLEIGPMDLMPSEICKRFSDRAIIRVVRRRQQAFQTALADILQYLQGSEALMTDGFNNLSLKDFIQAAKALSKERVDRPLELSLPRPPRGHPKVARCTSTTSLTAFEMLQHLTKKLGSLGQVVHCEHIKRREAAYGELQQTLMSHTSTALDQMGISKIYTHQAEAINAALGQNDVIIATSTASGKSLCYNIPVLDELYKNLDSCAMYLFPTKALAQDQLRALEDMSRSIQPKIVMGVYDGDTPKDSRLVLRDLARLLITNPDMLHVSILPYHGQFSRILSNLRYVVVDEGHAYQGVFGCHTALVLRRLRRLCRLLYGTEPTFIVCSATVANPSGHGQELIGLKKIKVVQDDGSPCGDKFFVLWNPPVTFVLPYSSTSKKGKGRQPPKLDPVSAAQMQKRRASPIVQIASIFAEMVQHGLRCIAFCKTRKLCELVYNYTQEILKETAPELVDVIRSYRSGYTARERRHIESELFGGKLRGVAATNALELGVDVGSLDATLHLGFPGTVASLWQQSGRAGRRGKPSLSVYVAFGSPLDQHFMKYPNRLFSRPIENAQVDAHNQQIVEQHLTCAANEYPLNALNDEEYFGSGLQTAIEALVKQGLLGRHPSNGPQDVSWHYIGHEKHPSQAVSIRAIEPEKYTVVNLATNEVIEEIEESKAFFEVYEGAVYLNQGKTYLVQTLDLSAKVALCRVADLKYYTKTRDFTDVHVTGGELAYPKQICKDKYRSTTAQASNCKVTTKWIGFRRIWQGTNETFDSVDLFLPEISYDSQAAWIRVPHQIRVDLESVEMPFRAGLHAACHAILNVMPLYIICNPSDLGTDCANPNDTRYYPERLLVFDRHPGGIGISAQARPMFAELLQAALELLIACECTTDDGCPSCVQYLDCSEYNTVLNKHAAIKIIQGVIQDEDICREKRAHKILPENSEPKLQKASSP